MWRGSTVNVSTVNIERVNSQYREGQQSMWRGSTVNVERVNSQLSREKAIASVDPGGVDQ